MKISLNFEESRRLYLEMLRDTLRGIDSDASSTRHDLRDGPLLDTQNGSQLSLSDTTLFYNGTTTARFRGSSS
jgi:hypothetical protein